MEGSCEHQNENSGLVKGGKFLAAQQGLCSTELLWQNAYINIM
jgi:hypothetical protein